MYFVSCGLNGKSFWIAFHDCKTGRSLLRRRGQYAALEQFRRIHFNKAGDALEHYAAGVFTSHRQHVLAVKACLHIGLAQYRVDVLLYEVWLPFFDQQNAALADAKAFELVVNQRVGDVEHIQRHLRLAEGVGQPQHFERTHHAVVKAALHDDAKVFVAFSKKFVHFMLLNKLHSRRPAISDLFLLLRVTGGRQHHATGITLRVFNRVLQGEGRPLVGLGREAPVHVAGAYTQLQHHGCVAGF